MARIATYVILDLETSGLPSEDSNKTRIIEFSLVAVKRTHLLERSALNEDSPRVQHKLTMCINPGKRIEVGATEASKLDNELLEFETRFTMDVFNTINSFIKCLEKPVCLIAHNGNKFDFPILKNHFEKLNVALSDDVMCADSLNAFYDILKNTPSAVGATSAELIDVTPLKTIENNVDTNYSKNVNDRDENVVTKVEEETLPLSMKQQNERTPTKPIMRREKVIRKARRRVFYDNDEKPKESYKLQEIYKRVVGSTDIKAHRAENDCILLLEIVFAKAEAFVQWVDEESFPFSQINPMTIGVSLNKIN